MLPIKRKRQRSASDARRKRNTIANLAPLTTSENGILRLPYELLLAIFHQLSDQEDVDSLALAHPAFKVVHRENVRSVERAVRCNDVARFVEKETGYRSLYLMKIARAIYVVFRTLTYEYAFYYLFNDEDFQHLRRDYKDECGWWLRLCRNQALCFHMLGFFDSDSTLDIWYKQRFCPMVSGYLEMNPDLSEFFKEPSHLIAVIADLGRVHLQCITWPPRARFEDIELIMVVMLWRWASCFYVCSQPHRIFISWPALSVSDFMSLFTPDVAHRAGEFARRFMKVRTDKQIWDKIAGWGLFDSLLHCKAMGELADISETEIPMDEEERDMVSYQVKCPHWLISSLEGVDELDIYKFSDSNHKR